MRTIRTRRHTSAAVLGYRFRVASLVLFLLAIAVEVRGQQRDDNLRVAYLVDRLGSASFARRQAAGRELLELGDLTIGPLEQAAAGDDPEVRLRAETLLTEIKTRRLWSASMIDSKSDEQLASVILRQAALASNNRLAFGGRFDNFVDRKVQLPPGSTTYWQVVDHVCRATNNHVSSRRQAETDATVIVAGKLGNHPVAYAGPLRVLLTQAKRNFSETLDYEDGTSSLKHTFAIDLAANWETRFRLLAHHSDAQIVAATTDQGQRLLAAPGTFGGWNTVSSGVAQIETTLRLQPPSVAASKLSELHVRWEFVAAGDAQTIEITDLETPRVYRQDDVELVFESFEKQSDTRYEASFVVSRAALIAELADLTEIENDVTLTDDSETTLAVHSRTTEDTSTSRRRTPFIAEGTRLVVVFLANSPEQQPTTLRFTYPKLRSRKSLDIIFRDVPLPATALD